MPDYLIPPNDRQNVDTILQGAYSKDPAVKAIADEVLAAAALAAEAIREAGR